MFNKVTDKFFGPEAKAQADAYNAMAAAERQTEALLNVKREVAANPLLAAPYGGATGYVDPSSAVKPSRPGDTPPRQFVGKTLTTLQATLQTYIQERELLAKDIAKLSEELSQLDEAIAAVQAAYDRLKPSPSDEIAIDQAALEHELNGVGKE